MKKMMFVFVIGVMFLFSSSVFAYYGGHSTHEHHWGPTLQTSSTTYPVNHQNTDTTGDDYYPSGSVSRTTSWTYSGSGGVEFGVDEYCQIKFGVAVSDR